MSKTVIRSLLDLNQHIKKDPNTLTFYRGHDRIINRMLPRIYRNQWINNVECSMHKALLAMQPHVYRPKMTTLDHLKLMNENGAPTRLLSFTSNPCVALFFACRFPGNHDREIVMIDAQHDICLSEDNPTVHFMANLCLLSEQQQNHFFKLGRRYVAAKKHKETNLERFISARNAFVESYEMQVLNQFSYEDVHPSYTHQFRFPSAALMGDFVRCRNTPIQAAHNTLYYLYASHEAYFKESDIRTVIVDKSALEAIQSELEAIGIMESTMFPTAQNETMDIVSRYKKP